MKNPLVSIIIPAYNAEKSIENICTSILMQDYKNIELIIVNDGSTDNTHKKLVSLEKSDPRVVVLHQKNSGVSEARNTGIRRANGKYLFFFDADDDIAPDMITGMTRAAIKNRKSLIVCGRELSNGISRIPKDKTVCTRAKTRILQDILRNDILYSPWNKIYDAELIKQHNILFDKSLRYGEDLSFNLDYMKFVDKIIYISKPYYYYFLSESGSSSKTSSVSDYRKKMSFHLLDFIHYNSYKPSLADLFLIFLIKSRWSLSVIKSKVRRFKKI